MLEVQTFLRSQSLEELKEQFAIKVRRHEDYPNLISLKYTQGVSPKEHPIVRECRGLILDEANDWATIAHPYHRFFNAGEGGADVIDWSSARCYDKLDGSLITLYFYKGQWHVATSGTPDGSAEVGGGVTFKKLFWKVWKDLGYDLPADQDCCYMFEIMTPFNPIVVRHDISEIKLHGARNIRTGLELDPYLVGADYGWGVVDQYPLQTIEEILTAAQTLEPIEAEGYIICDKDFNRIKVKSPAYVAISHLKDGFSTRRLLEILVANESSEFLTYFPQWTELYEQIKGKIEALAQELEDIYQAHKHIESQKEFALAVKDHPQFFIIFQRRSGQDASTLEGLKAMHIQHLERVLEIDYLDLGN